MKSKHLQDFRNRKICIYFGKQENKKGQLDKLNKIAQLFNNRWSGNTNYYFITSNGNMSATDYLIYTNITEFIDIKDFQLEDSPSYELWIS